MDLGRFPQRLASADGHCLAGFIHSQDRNKTCTTLPLHIRQSWARLASLHESWLLQTTSSIFHFL